MGMVFNNKKIYDSLSNPVTDEARFFLLPQNPRHRQYEALRAFFVELTPGKTVAQRFGYSPGAFRVLCHHFRNDQSRRFFLPTRPGPRHAPKKDQATQRIIELRKKNYSVKDIQQMLSQEGIKLSSVWIWKILSGEGFAKLPRRRDEERPAFPKPEHAGYADVRQLDLQPQSFTTKIGGLFLLMRIIAELGVHKIPQQLGWYGSKMIPPPNAFLSCLLLKLIQKERKSHVMDIVFDPGPSLSVGLNAVPKTAYISEYSERITHADNLRFLNLWLHTLRTQNIISGESFNLDFQSIPYYGEEKVVQKHYVAMRSRSLNSVLVFFAQDANAKIFCYSNADIRSGEEANEIFRFVDFWKANTGKKPPHLVFDSRLTTHANLSKLNQMDIPFITLRSRTSNVIKEIVNYPASAWRKIELPKVDRKYRTPSVIDKQVALKDYAGSIRQIFVKDLGHELPTVLLTNDMKTSCVQLITRYALRMLIENSIAAAVDFFHTTALSSSVAMRVDFDLVLILVAQTAYHVLASKLRGYEEATPNTIFRKFIDTPATINIGEDEIEVRLSKRADNPILLNSGLLHNKFTLPWVGNRPIVITTR
jgi:transposase